ncbi:MAG TPA: UvrD-helicase domain-containing protein [Pseudogracilibacillus sp.]|nr:UvrD-helicase domain-containing protein [Pseudogracilibacillus sp.]
MEILDQAIRNDIMRDTGNIVVSASAGSGKTTIMIDKMKQVLDNTIDHKIVAAITFTNKAASEIKKKAIEINIQKEFVTMTNDAFIEQFIIRPFITDTYGIEYKDNFTIDYTHNFDNYKKGMDSIKFNGVLGTFYNIKRNFKFQLAYDILKKNKAASEYLQAKFSTIFLDEYQDSDLDMHHLFMYLKNELKLNIFIVGDAKQAIYLWRGAQRNIFELLNQDDINYYELIHNFRSHEEIVNYSNLIHNSDYFNFNYNQPVNHVIHCTTNNFVSSFSQMIEDGYIDYSEEIVIIINRNNVALNCTEKLNSSGYNFQFIPRTPIDDNTPNSYLLRQLACYILDDNFSIYDLIENINVDARLQTVKTLEDIIKKLKSKTKLDQSLLFATLKKVAEFLEESFTHDELQLFFNTINNNQYHVAFISSDNIHKVMTVFASKGLEFNQVISFSNYYNLLSKEERNNHYVCVTRAENKFIMIDNQINYQEIIIDEGRKQGITDSIYLYKKLTY